MASGGGNAVQAALLRCGCGLHEPTVPGCTDTTVCLWSPVVQLSPCVTQRAYGELLCFRVLWAHVLKTGLLTAVLRSAQPGCCCRPLWLHAACVVVGASGRCHAICRPGSTNMWDQGALQLCGRARQKGPVRCCGCVGSLAAASRRPVRAATRSASRLFACQARGERSAA